MKLLSRLFIRIVPWADEAEEEKKTTETEKKVTTASLASSDARGLLNSYRASTDVMANHGAKDGTFRHQRI